MPTHDYTRRGWGHDYTFSPIEDGRRGTMMGWGRGIAGGDFLLIQNGSGGTRYRVEQISYYADPPDMWRASVVFAPRQADCPTCGPQASWEQWEDFEKNALCTRWGCGHSAVVPMSALALAATPERSEGPS